MINVFFRHYREDLYSESSRDPNKLRPAWFSNSICIFSLFRSIVSCKLEDEVRFYLWYDGSQGDLDSDPLVAICSYYANYLPLFTLRENYRELGSNASERISFPILLDFISNNFSDDDYFYLVENDYLHDSRALSSILSVTRDFNEFSYGTLFDSPDYYNLPIHLSYMSQDVLLGEFNWRTVLTTTGSFFTSRRVISEDRAVFSRFTDFDAFTRLVGLRGRKLIAPRESLSVHLMVGHYSPLKEEFTIIEEFNRLVRQLKG